MLSAANPALDLLILELVLHSKSVGILGLVLRILPPGRRGLEDDVLAHGGGVARWSGSVLGRLPELGPCLALGDPRVDHLAVLDQPDAPRRLDFLAVVVDVVLDHGGAAVLVLDLLWRREVRGDLVDVLVVSPIVPGDGTGWLATGWNNIRRGRVKGVEILATEGQVSAYFAWLDILLVVVL